MYSDKLTGNAFRRKYGMTENKFDTEKIPYAQLTMLK